MENIREIPTTFEVVGVGLLVLGGIFLLSLSVWLWTGFLEPIIECKLTQWKEKKIRNIKQKGEIEIELEKQNSRIDDKIKQQVKEEFEEFFTQLEKTELTREFLKEQVDKLKKTKI